LHVHLLGAFFLANNSQYIWLAWVPLEITFRNKVFSENILLGTLFLTVIFRGETGEPFLLNVLQLGVFLLTSNSQKNMVPLGFREINC
jgi:hypothetical protein